MKRKFKNIIRQIHLWLGLATGLVVIVIGITGALFVFEEEIRALTQEDFRFVTPQNKPFAGLDKIISSFEQSAKGDKIRGIRINEQFPNAAVEITTKKSMVYYYNPYNATLIKKGGLNWLDVVQHIHTSLLLGKPGEFIIRWSVVIFVLMLISGLILWFPGQMRLLRQSLTIKRKASFKRLNYDLHNVLGFYASIVLLVTALSGLYFAFKEVKTMASFFTGAKLNPGNKVKDSKTIKLDSLPLRYQKIYAEAKLKYPGAIATNLSLRGKDELRLRMIYPYRWVRNQNTFFYKEQTGEMLRAKFYSQNNGADLIEATNYDLHTGKLLGLPGKILSFLASLIAASLPITGFIIWLKKRKKPAKKLSKKLVD
ncbi:PepSY-associated TM helix domain-containing protein [Pedobacter punctiformis]|uniref:PepSY-associated TM helix domain-containing protein n=1 Tax=Pedobacter punctiformis TaxID=3004097 RepID=A0ABT4L6S7_9SPHI|nr:PepSY-associated TM helix domain-containing protein [Pedobacter sp. HCMS5-2]MCZ4243536.1 PepSY-associated TM helix domain-containing protein [Pedobacter sp. HCMS5-2]